ncbi:MAG TPA: outer membrane beta-barrel protein [Geothermobacteraceae bacterium]|nr:outer membrane beta-barrel protein [Geothermobacteraceae bacterium]
MNVMRPMMICLFLLLLAGTAGAESHHGYYAGAWYGISAFETSTANDDLGSFNLEADQDSFWGISFGYDLPSQSTGANGRVEIEYGHRSNSFDNGQFNNGAFAASGDVQVESLLLNSFAVFPNQTRVSPYLGLGLGGAKLTIDNLQIDGQPFIDDECLVFAWQLGGGLEIELTRSLRVDLGYRYFSVYQPELNEVDGRKVKPDYTAHSGMLGVVWMF